MRIGLRIHQHVSFVESNSCAVSTLANLTSVSSHHFFVFVSNVKQKIYLFLYPHQLHGSQFPTTSNCRPVPLRSQASQGKLRRSRRHNICPTLGPINIHPSTHSLTLPDIIESRQCTTNGLLTLPSQERTTAESTTRKRK